MRRLCGGMQSADKEHWRPPRTWWVPLEARLSGYTAQGRVTGLWDRAKTISRNAGMCRTLSSGCENNRRVLPSFPFSRSATPFQSRIQHSHQLHICKQLHCHSYLLQVKPKSICWWGSYTPYPPITNHKGNTGHFLFSLFSQSSLNHWSFTPVDVKKETTASPLQNKFGAFITIAGIVNWD